MALSRWLKNNNIAYYFLYYDGLAHSQSPTSTHFRAAGRYLYFAWDRTNVDSFLGEESTRITRIAEVDPSTRENAFHTVFATALSSNYGIDAYHYKNHYIAWQDALSLTYRVTDDYWYVPTDNTFFHYKAQHETLLRNGKLTPASALNDFRKQLMTDLVDLLLKPFDGDDAAFMQAFLQTDKKGNTPFFYAVQMFSNQLDFDRLLARINRMKIADKRRLYLEPNHDNKTVLHLIIARWDNADSILNDSEILKAGLRQGDNKGNTPLHDLFLLRTTLPVLPMLQKITSVISASKALADKKPELHLEQKSDEMPDYLCVNRDGANPLHCLCQRTVYDASESMLAEILKIAGPLKSEKILQPDNSNLTPVHYAIKSGNFSLALKMIEHLKYADQIKLIMMAHHKNKNENLLHYICQHGNRELLSQAVQIIGPLECYQIRRQLPLKAFSSNKKNLPEDQLKDVIKKHNVLFELFDYFCGKYNAEEDLYHQSEAFKARFDDFCACYTAIQLGYGTPEEPRSFYKNTLDLGVVTLSGTETYHQLRHSLNEVTPEERSAFMALLVSMIKGTKTNTEVKRTKTGIEIEIETGAKMSGKESPSVVLATQIHQKFLAGLDNVDEQKTEPLTSSQHLTEDVNGRNALHRMCNEKKTTVDSLQAMLQPVHENYRAGRILKVDRYGMTSVHYAIKAKRFDLADALLAYLNPEQQKNVMQMQYHEKETTLHLVCQYGIKTWLEKAIDILGPEKLHEIRSEKPLKANADNPQLSQKEIDDNVKIHSRLFDTFDYLVEKTNKWVFLSEQPEVIKRLDDFCACYFALQQRRQLPGGNPEFHPKKFGVVFWNVSVGGKYQHFRFSLGQSTPKEQKEFGDFISKVAADEALESSPARIIASEMVAKLEALKREDNEAKREQVRSGEPAVVVHLPAGAAAPAYDAPPPASAPPAPPHAMLSQHPNAFLASSPPPYPGDSASVVAVASSLNAGGVLVKKV